MKIKNLTYISLLVFAWACTTKKDIQEETSSKFNIEQDLLLLPYDCKTDVDDLHSAAAFVTLLTHTEYSKINYHAVAGTYGTQEGLYVPPNDLFQLAFGDNWSDAHADFDSAVNRVKVIAKTTLKNSGDIWIAEAGQSDFSAALVKALMTDMPDLKTNKRIHIVQHSDWNEEVTDQKALKFAKENTDYQKIPDGNTTDNGTPGFRSPEVIDVSKFISDEKLLAVWQLAIELGNQYNGSEGRYLNEAIKAGGLDFSDFSEVCWILGMEDIRDAKDFFGSMNMP